MGPKGGKSKVKGKDKGRQPAPVVEEEPEQDLMQQAESEGDNRGDPDQSEGHSVVDVEPIAAGPANKMKTKTWPVQTTSMSELLKEEQET